jgi:hypothetical protein
MVQKFNISEMDKKIQLIKKTAQEMTEMAGDSPALYRNARRILAGIKMLELDVSDIKDLVD